MNERVVRNHTNGLYIKTSDDANSWRRFQPMTRGRYAMEAIAWIALGLIVGVLAMALVACDASSPPAPDAALPACPATCTGLCNVSGQCTCDGMTCQREHHGFGDAGVDLIGLPSSDPLTPSPAPNASECAIYPARCESPMLP